MGPRALSPAVAPWRTEGHTADPPYVNRGRPRAKSAWVGPRVAAARPAPYQGAGGAGVGGAAARFCSWRTMAPVLR
jgi:hypothetical protein